jgi:hypothetical protein
VNALKIGYAIGALATANLLYLNIEIATLSDTESETPMSPTFNYASDIVLAEIPVFDGPLQLDAKIFSDSINSSVLFESNKPERLDSTEKTEFIAVEKIQVIGADSPTSSAYVDRGTVDAGKFIEVGAAFDTDNLTEPPYVDRETVNIGEFIEVEMGL